MYKYFQKIGSTESIAERESKGLSNEIIKPPDKALFQQEHLLVKECM